MMKPIFSFGFILGLSLSGFAWGESAKPAFGPQTIRERVMCEISGQKVEFLFSTDTATLSSWDGDGHQNLWFQSKKRPIVLGADWDVKPISGSGPCGSWLSVAVGTSTVGLAIAQGGRPFPDSIGVVFVDIKKGKRVVANPALGTVFDSEVQLHPKPEVVAVAGGFRFLEWTPRTDAGGSTVRLRGREVTTNETDFFYWKRVRLRNGRLVTDIDREQTWKDSSLRRFFKNQSQFEKAFGLTEDDARFKKANVVATATIGYTSCIQPSADRKPVGGDVNWFCTE